MTPCVQVCSIQGHATVETPLSMVDSLRDGRGSAAGAALPKRFLRHCDEQSVVGTVAVLRAIDSWLGPRPSFERFGVLSASCQPGRLSGARTLVATRAVGAQGVSPHVVPQCSLHSPASAVSVGLSMHGPHVGIGGGLEAFDEGIITAWSFLSPSAFDAADVPAGFWLVLTGWDVEPSLGQDASPLSDPTCQAIAMALVPGKTDGKPSLELTRGDHADPRPSILRGSLGPLIAALAGTNRQPIPLMHGFMLQVHPADGDPSREAA